MSLIRGISLLIAAAAIFFFLLSPTEIKKRDYDYDVTIYRDNWGVPHIYGETDQDAAFGLGYAHAEDDFETIQEVLLALKES